MNKDLEIIKVNYGEKMAQFCREQFPELLEEKDLLSQIMLTTFTLVPSHTLYDDILANNFVEEFKSYIYHIAMQTKKMKDKEFERPEVLLRKAGYTLYQCRNLKDLEKVKKYYNYEGNEGNKTLWDVEERWIDDFYTFFAVKDNADKIKRKIFANSKRNDEYATSVLCIQFSKMAGLQLPEQMWYIDGHKRAFGYNWNLYIQNRYDIEFNLARYNKTGYSPIQNNAPIFYNDRTFGNNLDNIVFGLSRSFEKYYRLKTKNRPYYHLPGYVKAKDGRYYKYNYRKISDFSSVVDICFCPNNTIIDNGEVIKLPEDKYLLIDYFILDLRPRKSVLHYIKNVLSNYDQDPIDSILKGRRIAPYYKYEIDSFPKSIPDKSQVMVRRYFEGKEIIISSPNKEDIIITIDKNNVITELVNNNIEEVGDMFLAYNYKLENFEAKKLRNTGKCFVKKREQFLSKFNLPNYNQTTNLK